MDEPPNSEDTKDVWKDSELINLMEKSLPMYVVKCFLYAGYDNIAAIVQITTEGPNNTLDQIEQFIIKYFPSDASCYSSNFTAHQREKFKTPPFVFLPGHRFLIAKFISDVKAKQALNNKLSRKRPAGKPNDSITANTSTGAKKQKIVGADAQEATGDRYNLEYIFDDVRKRIVGWQKKHPSSEIKGLHEHSDYKVECKLNSSGNLEVTVWCRFCNKKHQLGTKEVKSGCVVALLSNWTSHVPKCIERWNKLERSKQPTITSKFLQANEKPSKPERSTQDDDTSKNGSNVASYEAMASEQSNLSKKSEADCDKILVADEVKHKETVQDFQYSPPVLVSQEGK